MNKKVKFIVEKEDIAKKVRRKELLVDIIGAISLLIICVLTVGSLVYI